VLPSVYWLLMAFAIAHIPLQRLIDAMCHQTSHGAISWRMVLSGWLLVAAIILSAGESAQFIYFEF
jgi:hypothetical protein